MKILRPILAVVVGYVVMAVLGIGLFVGLACSLGVDRLFEPGSFRSQTVVHVAAIVIGIVIAIIGGAVCQRSGRSHRPVIVLAALVLVFGLGEALANRNKPDAGPRPANMPLREAVTHGREPDWLAFLNPFIGVVGVL